MKNFQCIGSVRNKEQMVDGQSTIILGQTISVLLEHILDIKMIWKYYCVCISNEHKVVLS